MREYREIAPENDPCDWLKNRSGRCILIYSAGQGLINGKMLKKFLMGFQYWQWVVNHLGSYSNSINFVQWHLLYFELPMRKCALRHLRLTATQICMHRLIRVFVIGMKKLCILGCWKCAQPPPPPPSPPPRVKVFYQPVRMPRLVWIFIGCLCPIVCFLMLHLSFSYIYLHFFTTNRTLP